MAEEENWIKEMEQILSQGDIGHDLTTIHLLLSKHKSLETEIKAHESTFQMSVQQGNTKYAQGPSSSRKCSE